MKNRIKDVRKRCSRTQQSFAESLNVSKSTIEAIEYGRREATDRIVSDICRVYGVNEDWLRTGAGEMFEPKDREQEIAAIVNEMLKNDTTDFRYRLTKALYELNEEEIQTLRDIAVKMAETVIKNKDAPE